MQNEEFFPVFANLSQEDRKHLSVLLKKDSSTTNEHCVKCFVTEDEVSTLKMFEISIENGQDVTAKDNAALCSAVTKGYTKVVRLLLENGADPTARNNMPIYAAVKEGHTEIVRSLLEKGASATITNNWPVDYAVQNNHKEMVELLVNHQAYSDSALCWAITKDDVELTRRLLKNRASTIQDNFPFLYTKQYNFALICTIMIGNQNPVMQELSLHYATSETDNDDIKNVETCLNKTWYPNCYLCSMRTDNTEIASFLLKHGANITPEALKNAISQNLEKVLKFFLENGADVKASDAYCTIINSALWSKNEKIVELLIDYGAPLKEDNLILASASKSGRLIQKIIDHTKPSTQKTLDQALIIASRKGNMEGVQTLLNNGADPTAQNNRSITASQEFGHSLIEKVLAENS